MNRDKHGSTCEILTEHLADLAKANPQYNQMEGHLTVRNSEFQNK